MVKKISEFRIHALASGSKGNCLLVEAGATKVLVDLGISHRRLCQKLNALDLSLKDISALFITHEHKDHVSGLPTFMKTCDINVFAKENTWRNMPNWRDLRKNYCQKLRGSVVLGSLRVDPFAISHDAAEPVGFNMYTDNAKCSILTDVGFPGAAVRECIRNADYLVLEANHDLQMLQNGSYPAFLKQRIRSNKGHLSNEDAAWLLNNIAEAKSMKVILAHLSGENNTPEIALNTVRGILKLNNKLDKIKLQVALQDTTISM